MALKLLENIVTVPAMKNFINTISKLFRTEKVLADKSEVTKTNIKEEIVLGDEIPPEDEETKPFYYINENGIKNIDFKNIKVKNLGEFTDYVYIDVNLDGLQ